MSNYRRCLLAVTVFLCVLLFSSCGADNNIYENEENWAYLPDEITEEADVFLIAPTVFRGDEEHLNMELSDEEIKAKFLGSLNMQRGIYEEAGNLYAPYYSQASLASYTLPDDESEEALNRAYKDVRTAFLYYMEHYNDGRPIVLAGFSQGAHMEMQLLEEFFDESDYQDKLIAAYVIGDVVTPQILEEYPHLVMAQGEADLGCIISFNSEAEDVKTSFIAPEKTIGINPLNWKTDSTEAAASENMGACFADYEGNIIEEIPELCGCYLDDIRGTLKVTGISKEDYPPVLDIFDSGVYHVYDYRFFYRNLQQNVNTRVSQYLTIAYLEEKNSATAEPDDSKMNNNYNYVSLADGVTDQMQDEKYWINRTKNPDEILMLEDQIEKLSLWEEAGYTEALSPEYKGIISKELLIKYLDGLKRPEYDCYMDGEVVSEEYWDKLDENCNKDAIQDQNRVQYGVTVNRTNMRILPTDDCLADEAEFTFYDELQNSSTLFNEPLVILHTSKDGKWYYCRNAYCDGWIHADDVAVCRDIQQFHDAVSPKEFLIVTGDRIYTEYDNSNEAVSERELTMGTKIPIAEKCTGKTGEGRVAMNNYEVMLPIRNKDGYLAYDNAFLPVSRDVHIGYLEYTKGNVLTQALKLLGDRYGWGGMYGARDCSQYAMEIYDCFGIHIPRNSGDQACMPCRTLNLNGLPESQKKELLNITPPGSILFFTGHIMIYLGCDNEQYYVVSAVGAYCPDGPDDLTPCDYQTIMINDLDVCRKNGSTWLQSLKACKII